ncbi:hypothetical protein [Pseudogemmobacter humi]|uniref:Lipoprotein n=1 Tax=Pseudogemmobacter humi TaxID=2483812 RepID=A0A3P5WLA6_9RHOB|nr:hypothetical protein [Pseudogemmobacter humi]VDC22458.1 hypothetical protein XINFAN_00781 [Pseudogemmobacter humi]
MILRLSAALLLTLLAACGAKNDLKDPPVPLGDFVLGHNIIVAENVQKVPISRDASPAEWEQAMKQAVADRFGRYEGSRIYNIGISVDGYALAPPGIPVVAAPKSVLVITANIWDDAAEKKLNPEGHQITVFESLSGETVIGTGLTRTKAQQMEALSFNAAKKVEDWLLEHPEWFGMTRGELDAALKEREARIAAAPPEETPAGDPAPAGAAEAGADAN